MTNTKFINGFKLMKKLLFLIPLIAFGFFLAVFYIPGSQKTNFASNPDNPGDPSVTDSFTTTTMVASNENLIVDTTAGQVKLTDVCYGIANGTQVPGCNGVCQACQNGACGVRSAGEYGLPACQRCDGVSMTPVNIANNTQDTEGSNLCNQICKKCSAGSCINQTNSEDLFGQCSASVVPHVVLNSNADISCGSVCASISCETGLCNGLGACGGPCTCKSVGTDAAGTNMKACVNTGINQCDSVLVDAGCGCCGHMDWGCNLCMGHVWPWTYCRCE